MIPSRETALRLAGATGFEAAQLEVVLRLRDLLEHVNGDEHLRPRLALKGGTPLNLCFGPPPRLSVDLDFNYIGGTDRETMQAERPEVLDRLERIGRRAGYRIQKSRPEHAGERLFLRYRSAFGHDATLVVDLNFLHRVPLDPVETRRFWDPAGASDLRALAAGELKLRFHFSPAILPGEGSSPRDHRLQKPLTVEDLEPYKALRETYRGPLLTIDSIKGMLDGTVDARTAAMFDPYVGGGTGIPFWEQDDLNRTVALYDKEGFQVLLHAIGDKAINMALNAFEYAATTNGTADRRHRIEHVEVPLLSDFPRFKALGVIASTQPLFASPDQTVLQNFAVLLGPERASHADSFKMFDDAGAVQAFGSDWSVFDFSPLKGIYAAVTRQTPEGTPADGWYPEGRITVEAALRHYTRDGAYATFDEDVRGTLAPGALADFVVLSRDILTIPPATSSPRKCC